MSPALACERFFPFPQSSVFQQEEEKGSQALAHAGGRGEEASEIMSSWLHPLPHLHLSAHLLLINLEEADNR